MQGTPAISLGTITAGRLSAGHAGIIRKRRYTWKKMVFFGTDQTVDYARTQKRLGNDESILCTGSLAPFFLRY